MGFDGLIPAACWWCGECNGVSTGLCAGCEGLLPWLGSQVCPRCARWLAAGVECGRCLRLPPKTPRTRAALRFDGLAQTLVHAFKFDRDLVAGRILAEALARSVNTYTLKSVLIPIPSTQRRRGDRGFDPAVEIARVLGRRVGLRVETGVLFRRGDHVPQSSLVTRAARRSNIAGMFHVEHQARVAAQRILVDDVLTSGATSDAAASALALAGLPVAELWVCTRTP